MRRRSKAGGEPVKTRRPRAVTLKRGNATKSVRSRRSSAAGHQKKVALLARELDEAHQQQAATADVLKVMSRSTFDLQSVLDILAESAARLCEADLANIWRPHGSVYRLAAAHQPFKSSAKDYLKNLSIEPSRGTCVGRTLLEGRIVHIHDILDDPDYALATSKLEGVRTMLGVPLLREGAPIGVIALARSTCRPFTAQQIELATTFAAQAVIAIENTRLLSELRQRTDDLTEALEQQTATSEVLRVISSSPGELEPVFQAMLENAVRICDAKFGTLYRYENETFEAAAHFGAPPAYVKFQRQRGSFQPPAGTALDCILQKKELVSIADVAAAGDASVGPAAGAAARFGGARSLIAVPMLEDNALVGAISVYRQEVKPFTDKQIALVQNFAAQAVIAIENTRLLSELRQRTTDLTESLEQQSATSEVLSVISSSPGDLEPVFVAMLSNAVRICGANFGNIYRWSGDALHLLATHNTPPAFAEARRNSPFRPGPDTPTGRMVATKTVTHVADLAAEPRATEQDDREVRFGVDVGGIRTLLSVPMLKEDELVGAFTIYRQEVRPFTEKQIELVQNFAAQAVIAIENARLLNELRQSLEQQTATAEVLRVISTSPGDLEPVFEAMLENAMRFCEARFGTLLRFDGNAFRLAAGVGIPPELADFHRQHETFQPVPNSPLDRAMRTKRVSHTADDAAEAMPSPPARLAGARTIVCVPMLKDDAVSGAIVIYRQEVRPFTDKQIELLTNFASQAVIAIENTRLLNELRQSLEQQTATADVLKVISSSRGNLEPVFEAMLENATRICAASFGSMVLREGDGFRRVALHNAPPEFAEFNKKEPFIPAGGSSTLDRIMATKQILHLPVENPDTPLARFAGARTVLGVPLLKDNELIGVFGIYRREILPFTDKQIELAKNFAAQAVIAIENARLLNELRESLQQQTATSDVLKVISRSTFDLQTVLDTLVESAARLCDADMAATHRLRGVHYEHAASYGIPPELHDHMKAIQFEPDRGSVTGRTVLGRKVVHVHDVRSDPEYTLTAAVEKLGARTTLGVPLLREGVPIGVFILMRRTVRPFTDKQIELLSTFADQAVIAIENVRLFEAEQQRTRELAKSLEDLQTAQDRLVQTQKLASLGQLTAGIAHEIKNPLNFVNNFSGLSIELLDELQEAVESGAFDDKRRTEIAELTDTLRGNLDKIAQHGKRADSIVKNMLLHSREGSGERRSVDVNAMVEESLNLAYHGARAEKQGFNITLERSFDPGAGEVDVFPQEITRVLLNLISNGFYAATKRQGEVDSDGYEPILTASTRSLGDKVEIRLRDNGTGIPPEVKEKMFNPFFTTKPAGEGTGLGLSISHDIIVKQHSGAIEVDTEPGMFTEFRIILPRTAA